MDRAVAYAVLLAASPAIAARGAIAVLRTGRVLEGDDMVGAHGRPFRVWRFAGEQGGSDLLALAAVAGGHMRLIGPAPLTPAQLRELRTDEQWRRTAVPGLYSAGRLQQQLGIAYDAGSQDQDIAAADSLTTRERLGLLARSVIAATLAGTASGPTPEQLRILDVTIANISMAQALDWVFDQAARDLVVGRGRLVCFVNPSCLNVSVADIGYRAVLHRANLVLPDGIGIKLATRIQGVGLRDNVNGTDMFPRLCERAARTGTALYLLGARDGVAKAAGRAMCQAYPGLRIAGTHHGYVAGEEERVVAEINASGAQILLVAMGVPQQELWLERLRPQLAPAVLMGVGGLFDFYSGRIARAPLWVREIGMEWAWRLMKEPGRMWRRYVIGNPLFLFRVWRQQRANSSVVGHAPTAVSTGATSSLRSAVVAQRSASARVVAAVLGRARRRTTASRRDGYGVTVDS